jgi:hypothetical protein
MTADWVSVATHKRGTRWTNGGWIFEEIAVARRQLAQRGEGDAVPSGCVSGPIAVALKKLYTFD